MSYEPNGGAAYQVQRQREYASSEAGRAATWAAGERAIERAGRRSRGGEPILLYLFFLVLVLGATLAVVGEAICGGNC